MSLVQKFIPGNEVNNALFKAIFSGDLEKVGYIVDSYGLSYSPSWADGFDLLLTAVECKHSDVAKLLMSKGCKLKEPQSGVLCTSKSLIHLAVRKGDPELVGLLLDKNKNYLTELEEGDSLLHTAITEGQKDIVELLLAHGADIEFRTRGGMTPLHLAAIRGHVEIVELLLASKADIESQDSNEKTVLFLAVSSGHKAVVQTLLEAGANCKCKSKNGQTPLLDATSKCYVDIVGMLLNYGADFNDRNNLGQTPLHIACMLKNKYLISVLLQAGADVNTKDSNGMVPCDAIVKKSTSFNTYFEDSSVSYLLGRHFCILVVAGLYLNEKNQCFYKLFYDTYCNEIIIDDVVLSSMSNVLHNTIQCCEEQISLMKEMRSDSGFTFYDVFKKLKDPSGLSVTNDNEIRFLESVDLHSELYLYEVIIKKFLKIAKLRLELLATAEEWLSFLIRHSQNRIPALPEEMRIYVMSYLTNDELKQLIQCAEDIRRQNNT